MQTIQEYTGRLIVDRCWCGIQLALPESLYDLAQPENDYGKKLTLYCPLGHSYIRAGESRLSKEKAAHARTISCLNDVQNRLKNSKNTCRGLKSVNTRIKNRIANGVCPCCNRSFKNLHRHMKSQHPTFATQESKP